MPNCDKNAATIVTPWGQDSPSEAWFYEVRGVAEPQRGPVKAQHRAALQKNYSKQSLMVWMIVLHIFYIPALYNFYTFSIICLSVTE